MKEGLGIEVNGGRGLGLGGKAGSVAEGVVVAAGRVHEAFVGWALIVELDPRPSVDVCTLLPELLLAELMTVDGAIVVAVVRVLVDVGGRSHVGAVGQLVWLLVWLLTHLPSFPGRQLLQIFLAFAQAQPLQEPVRLHLQHTIEAH